MLITSVSCCGVRELGEISTYPESEDAMVRFMQHIYSKLRPVSSSKFRYAIFTQAQRPDTLGDHETRYGYKFAAYIRKNGLGELVETGFNVNPNSNNSLKVWVWTVDHDALGKLYRKLCADFILRETVEQDSLNAFYRRASANAAGTPR